jgi:DNA invertase Pin-like site-specific DNA recombinase
MKLPTTPEELVEVLKQVSEANNDIAPEDYKYVLYVRKSTDDKDKQVRSLKDQITECREFAEDQNINLVKIIQESESAKQPDIRPGFRKMLEDIKAGTYDGIFAWHPDRLARNMKDAGEIIDLLDKGVIKNLKFKSFNYENTSSGKMHLGITFVLSKQYSDHLSESVNRGNKRSNEEGKHVNTAPHGYYKDKEKFLCADGNNYIIIKNAFKMRVEGTVLKEIAEYIVGSGYTKMRKDGKRYAPKINKQTVSKIMANPVYTGVLWYGKKNPVNLCEFYPFAPMLTVEEFMNINRLNESGFIELSSKFGSKEAIKADLLRDMVTCDICQESMSAGITPKKTKDGKTNYFYYRCDSPECPVYGKSTRAKVIVDYVCNYLKEKPFSSRCAYTHYEKEMKRVSNERILEAKGTLRSLKSKLNKLNERYDKTKLLLVDDADEEMKDIFKDDLRSYEKNRKKVNKDITKVEAIIEKGKASILTYEEFLELMENMPKTIANLDSMADLDYIIKRIFLNFYIKDKKVVKTTLKSPFDSLKTKNVLDGAPCGTTLERF